MKKKLAILFLVAAGAAFARGRFFVGFGFGGWRPVVYPAPYIAYAPPPPPVAAYAPPVYPGPRYTWIGGYYYPVGARRAWRPGYWAARPWAGAVWVASSVGWRALVRWLLAAVTSAAPIGLNLGAQAGDKIAGPTSK